MAISGVGQSYYQNNVATTKSTNSVIIEIVKD